MIYLDLFLGFLRVGCFAFGGAYGAIPLIRDIVLSYGWLTDEALTTVIAISESTPGPIMINVATYVGIRQAGFSGALLATTAVILPSFIVILLIMTAMKGLLSNQYVQAVLRGLKPCIVGIVLATGAYMTAKHGHLYGMWLSTLVTVILAVILFGSKALTGKKISPIMFILAAGCLGAVVYGI